MAGSEADSVREKQDISRPKVFKSAPGSSVVHDICFVIVDLLKILQMCESLMEL